MEASSKMVSDILLEAVFTHIESSGDSLSQENGKILDNSNKGFLGFIDDNSDCNETEEYPLHKPFDLDLDIATFGDMSSKDFEGFQTLGSMDDLTANSETSRDLKMDHQSSSSGRSSFGSFSSKNFSPDRSHGRVSILKDPNQLVDNLFSCGDFESLVDIERINFLQALPTKMRSSTPMLEEDIYDPWPIKPMINFDEGYNKPRTAIGLVDLDITNPCTKTSPCLLDKLIFEEYIQLKSSKSNCGFSPNFPNLTNLE